MTPLSAPALDSSLGERIVWARKRKGISQERLAAMIGTSRRHMIRIEKGQHRPGPVFIERIADATEQPLEVFGGEEVVEPDDEEADAAMRAVFALFGDLVERLVDAKLAAREGARA